MPLLTPYSAKFAGYRIEEGTLSLDLDYVIDDDRLDASNNILIDQLTLGREVDSPSAMNVPLKLAVALLKDPSGRIDLDLPVTGNLDDPQFSYGQVVLKALGNLLTKVVTSPFRLLAGIVGLEGDEDLSDIAFRPGEATLAPPEQERLQQLAEALRQRPNLILELRGRWAPESDARVLKQALLESRISGLLENGGGEATGDGEPAEGALPSPRIDALERLYLEYFAPERLNNLRAAHTRAAELTPEGEVQTPARLDEGAYAAALREELLGAIELPAGELEALAERRASAATDYLFTQAALPEARYRTLEPAAVEEDADTERIPLGLELNAP